MLPRLLLFFLFSLFCSGALGQLDSLFRQREIEVRTQKDSMSASARNFFHQFGGTLLLDFGAGNPTGTYQHYTGPDNKRDSIPQGNDYLTLGEFTYEPRYNLFNYSDFFSISVNLPTSAKFCIYLKHEGVFGLRTIPMVDLNFFNHSTANNFNRFGFSLGAGFALNVAPLVFFEARPGYTDKRFWTSPVVRVGFKLPFRGKNSFANFTYGFPSEKRTLGPLRYSKGWLFVATVGILLNYD